MNFNQIRNSLLIFIFGALVLTFCTKDVIVDANIDDTVKVTDRTPPPTGECVPDADYTHAYNTYICEPYPYTSYDGVGYDKVYVNPTALSNCDSAQGLDYLYWGINGCLNQQIENEDFTPITPWKQIADGYWGCGTDDVNIDSVTVIVSFDNNSPGTYADYPINFHYLTYDSTTFVSYFNAYVNEIKGWGQAAWTPTQWSTYESQYGEGKIFVQYNYYICCNFCRFSLLNPRQYLSLYVRLVVID